MVKETSKIREDGGVLHTELLQISLLIFKYEYFAENIVTDDYNHRRNDL